MMQVQKATAYPQFARHENQKPEKGKHGKRKEPLRNYATISYTEVTPEFKKAQKTSLGLMGGSVGLMLSSVLLAKPLHQGIKKVLPAAAKKISSDFISGSLSLAAMSSFLGGLVACASTSNRYTQQFFLKNVDLHALRGGNAQQLERLG